MPIEKNELPNDLTVAEYQECLEYFGGACCHCGTVTNLVPVSKGGGTTKSNIVCACPSCNSSKGNKDMAE
jgi:5-methylcytosine-specific restriction endonuclease McrA